MQEYEDLKVLVAEIEADVDKAEGGNKAAGTRVRKQMQKIKQAAQKVRSCILEIRSVP
ncbi:MAG: hypothetical protein JSU70_11960 [Phycisphaerales bacterium]|nr:MAG: hypothetical protein JSU70_11960 [Phycisphaerales bacterium]